VTVVVAAAALHDDDDDVNVVNQDLRHKDKDMDLYIEDKNQLEDCLFLAFKKLEYEVTIRDGIDDSLPSGVELSD